MKLVALGIVTILVLGVGGFFIAGFLSKSGVPPGLVDGALADCPSSPNCVSSEPSAPSQKRVEPLPVEAWSQIPRAIAAMGGVLTVQEDGYLAAEFTSRVFQFTDDVEFRLSAEAVHLRSASRIGYSDAGTNKARIDVLRAQLNGS